MYNIVLFLIYIILFNIFLNNKIDLEVKIINLRLGINNYYQGF